MRVERHPTSWKGAAFVLCCVTTVAAQPHEAEPTTLPAIDVILEQLERGRARLPTVQYEQKSQSDSRSAKGELQYDIVQSVIRNGSAYSGERSQSVLQNGEPYFKTEGRTLLTNRTCAVMDFRMPYIQEWSFQPRDPVPDDAKQIFGLHTYPDVLTWGYGIGHGQLRDLLHVTVPNRLEARNVQRGSEVLIELDFIRLDDGKERLVSTYVSDPSRGYLITLGRQFDDAGKVVAEYRVETAEIADGVWFPTRITSWDEVNKNKLEIEVSDLKVLPPQWGDFEFRLLRPAEGARVTHFHKDGHSEGYIVRGGKSIPLTVDVELRKQD